MLQQEVYDSRSNQLLASATATDFNFYPAEGVSLPRSVQISLPPASLQFSLRIDTHTINQNYIDPSQMWTMPQPEGAELVDVNRLSSPPPNYVEPNYVEPTYRGAMANETVDNRPIIVVTETGSIGKPDVIRSAGCLAINRHGCKSSFE